MDRPMANPALVRLFLGLQLTGAIGMIITLCTAILSRRVKRNATWYAFCVSWVVSCASYCLLFFAGAQFGSEPSHTLCVTQASLAYAAPALIAWTTLALLTQVWYNIHYGFRRPPLEKSLGMVIALLVFPYLIWLSIFLTMLISGIRDSTQVIRNDFYCVFVRALPANISSLLVIIASSMMVPIQISLGISVFKSVFYSNMVIRAKSIQTIKMVLRVMSFSLLIVIALVEGVVHLFIDIPCPAIIILMSTLPVSALLLFGTQTDLFNAWAFWRKPATRRTPTPSLQSMDSMKMKSIKELEASASTPFTDLDESYTDPWSPTPPYSPTNP